MNKTLNIQVPSSAPSCKARKALLFKAFRAFSFSDEKKQYARTKDSSERIAYIYYDYDKGK